MPDSSVSPADPIRPCIAHVGHPTTRPYPEICDGCKADAALGALLAVGERDRQRIRDLTEGLGQIKNKMMAQPYGASPEACAVADWVVAEVDAVLAGEEDTANG